MRDSVIVSRTIEVEVDGAGPHGPIELPIAAPEEFGTDFELRADETLAIVGDNGAGKSTLIKILSGATAPDEGELRLDGSPVTFSGPSTRLMGCPTNAFMPDLPLSGLLVQRRGAAA